jgi:hypothetical protein
MQRVNVYLTKLQIKFLKSLPGTFSENMRRAIDEYIEKLTINKVSASKSERRAK